MDITTAKPKPPVVQAEVPEKPAEKKAEFVRSPHLTHRPFISPALVELRKSMGGKKR